MSPAVRWIVLIAIAQAALVGVYLLVEHRREEPSAAVSAELGDAPPEPVDRPMPALALRRRDGTSQALGAVDRPTLFHFWATWCPPCRVELPGLLALPREHPVAVVPVALDDDWAEIERVLRGHLPADEVLLADPREVERSLAIRTLPVTLLVTPDGRIRLRFDGARDWSDASFVKRWIGVIE